jgi:hypothetical protein
MPSPLCEKAISEALEHGNAILKFISPNDVGITGSHQCGFYLPKSAWEMYTPYAPEKGRRDKHAVSIIWPDGRETKSAVTWYGKKTRSEYRLTRFGRDFPYLTADNVGDLLVLIPISPAEFSAYVFDLDDDIDEALAALGVEPFERWGIYRNGVVQIESEDKCIDRKTRKFAGQLTAFPDGETFSRETRRILGECLAALAKLSADDVLMKCYETEYQLFRVVERQVCQSEIVRSFRDVDDFLRTASSIMNRRKSRAGRSLENHVDYLLTRAGIPHQMRPMTIDGKPDVIIPSVEAYHNQSYPTDKLFVVGIKTTCKDRWRQVLNEGRRVTRKHIFTIQQGISTNQLSEMNRAGVTLIVPKPLHSVYPARNPATMLNLQEFISSVKRKIV